MTIRPILTNIKSNFVLIKMTELVIFIKIIDQPGKKKTCVLSTSLKSLITLIYIYTFYHNNINIFSDF